MGKKKANKRDKEASKENCESSDDGTSKTTVATCFHYKKALNFANVQRDLKPNKFGECQDCQKIQSSLGCNSSATDEGAVICAADGEEEKRLADQESSTWMCLQCCHQGCGRDSKEKHAIGHYKGTKSAHCLVINTATFIVWCYLCEDEVIVDESKSNLYRCVEFLRKETRSSFPEAIKAALPERQMEQEKEPARSTTDAGGRGRNTAKGGSTAPSDNFGLSRVKGLSNLGNTCFFNAVMQNLSQTPLLCELIAERKDKMKDICCPASAAPSHSDVRNGQPNVISLSINCETPTQSVVQAEQLDVTLAECGDLTRSLLDFLNEMNQSKSSTIHPNKLFGKISDKAPRFRGFQQQDSHELLRNLLEGTKLEEIKRYQSSILKALKITNPQNVTEEEKGKVKAYGQYVRHTFVDSIFGGYFISSVCCEQCKEPSQIVEPFLDISLPIVEEKLQRPGSRKKEHLPAACDANNSAGATGMTGPSAIVDAKANQPSKHSLKKEKKQRKGKRKTGGKQLPNCVKSVAESASTPTVTEVNQEILKTEIIVTESEVMEDGDGRIEDNGKKKKVPTATLR